MSKNSSSVKIHTVQVRSIYDDHSNASPLANTVGPSLTIQSDAADCDINNILSKYQKTGLLDHVNQYQGHYSDITPYPDYHTAHNLILKAQDSFMSLPARVRARFDNDPGNFLDFVNNPENVEEMIKLGIANRVNPDGTPFTVPSPSNERPERAAQEPSEGSEGGRKPSKGAGA